MTFLSFLFFYKVGKMRQNIKNCLNQNLVIATFLENDSEASLRSKTNFLIVWKWYFSVFCNFWVAKLKLFSPKVRRNVKNYLNQNLVIGSFLQNGFEATLRSKANVLSIWKGKFSVFCNFWLSRLKPFSGKMRQNIKKLFKSKFDHRNLLRKWFGSFLELKNEYCGCLKRTNIVDVWKGHFSVFCKFLSNEVGTVFWESEKMLRKLFA